METVKICDAQDILLELSCAVSNLMILHAAMAEMGMTGAAINDAIYFTTDALQSGCDRLEICLNRLHDAELRRAGVEVRNGWN